MTREEVLKHFKTVANLASELGITPQAVYDWGDRVPEGRQWQIQAITKGKLKAGTNKRKTKAA